jgi:predicted transcriptional regulator
MVRLAETPEDAMADRPLKSTRLTVSLEEQDYDTLTEIALARDVSLSWVIRQAVRQFIEKAQADKEENGRQKDARTPDQ